MPISRLFRPLMVAALLGTGLVAGLAASHLRSGMSAGEKSNIEGIVKNYLMQNPEVLRDAMAELDRRQKADEEVQQSKAVSEQASTIFNSPHQEVLGNPEGKVTLVEFFDYNCAYCKKSLDDISRLLQENPDLRLVLKDFPVLGPGSIEAAKVAIALRNQFTGEKFWQFHFALLGTRGPVDGARALAVAHEQGADMDRLNSDMQSAEADTSIKETMQLADGLQLTGTPSFVLGQDVVVGAVGYDALKEQIDNVRKCGRSNCG